MEAQAKKNEAPKVIVRKLISADRERVFEAWTNPKLMQQWLFPGEGRAVTSNDLRVGGSYSHDMIMKEPEETCGGGVKRPDGETGFLHHGEYLEIVPPERIVFTWSSPAVTNTRVTVTLRAVEKQTEVTITHELLETEVLRASHTEGWNGCLENLERFSSRSCQVSAGGCSAA